MAVGHNVIQHCVPRFLSFPCCLYFFKLLKPSKITRKWNTTPKNARNLNYKKSNTKVFSYKYLYMLVL
jgi:hypothetical protein